MGSDLKMLPWDVHKQVIHDLRKELLGPGGLRPSLLDEEKRQRAFLITQLSGMTSMAGLGGLSAEEKRRIFGWPSTKVGKRTAAVRIANDRWKNSTQEERKQRMRSAFARVSIRSRRRSVRLPFFLLKDDAIGIQRRIPEATLSLEPRIYTSKEIADLYHLHESAIRRQAQQAWEKQDVPAPLKGIPEVYVVRKGSEQGGRKCGWAFQLKAGHQHIH